MKPEKNNIENIESAEDKTFEKSRMLTDEEAMEVSGGVGSRPEHNNNGIVSSGLPSKPIGAQAGSKLPSWNMNF